MNLANTRRIVHLALTGCVLAISTGCGAAEPSTSPAQPSDASVSSAPHADPPSVDVSVLHKDAHYDYAPAGSLTELAGGDWLDEGAATVALGEVVGWSEGRSVTEANRGRDLEWIQLHAILEVKVLQSYGSNSAADEGQRVYVEVPRGTKALVDGELPDDGGQPAFSTIDDLNAAIPQGTRVITVGAAGPTDEDLRSGTPGSTVQSSGLDLPDGATLIWPHIQGLLFEDETGGFVSGLGDDEEQWNWLPDHLRNPDGFQYLVSELAKLT